MQLATGLVFRHCLFILPHKPSTSNEELSWGGMNNKVLKNKKKKNKNPPTKKTNPTPQPDIEPLVISSDRAGTHKRINRHSSETYFVHVSFGSYYGCGNFDWESNGESVIYKQVKPEYRRPTRKALQELFLLCGRGQEITAHSQYTTLPILI